MYLGRKPKRHSSRRILLLLVLIAAASTFVYYIQNYQPPWAQPFEPTPTPTRMPESYIAEAEAYYGQGQLDQAIAAYEQAVAINPDNAAARIRLAYFLTWREHTAKAVRQAQQAVLLEPSNPQALAGLCQALDWNGHYAEAFEACECAIELDPDYAEAHAYLGRVYVDTGDWISARQYAQQAVELNYQSMEAHFNQGYVMESQGRYRQAVESYENAIVLHPKLPPLYIKAGQNRRVLGQFTEAIDHFEKAIRLNPADPIAYDQLGWTYYTSGQYGRAIDSLEQATLVDPNHTTSWGHLGIVYYVLQQYEEVIPALQQAINLAEQDYLRRARRVTVLGQNTLYDPPQPIEVMNGNFNSADGEDDATLHAQLFPALGQARTVLQPDQTCGDLIAYKLHRQATTMGTIGLRAEANSGDEASQLDIPEPVARFLDTRGQVTIDLDQRRLDLQLSGVPQPEGIPYEAQLLVWPEDKLSLGYFQPDAQGNATLDFVFKDILPAPVDYYTLMGFSYVFLGQCQKGVPWLLDSIEVDPSATNPAWQGLADCPETPAPQETPPPGTTEVR